MPTKPCQTSLLGAICLDLSADSDADGLLGFRQRQKSATVTFDPW
jgi:hypothetical protein